VLEKTLRRDHLNLGSLDVRFVNHSTYAAEMINVRVCVNHRGNRFARAILEVQLKARSGGFNRQQRVEHDQPVVALNNGHVGQIQATNLINAFSDLEQTSNGIELAYTPQARVDGTRCAGLVEECVLAWIPDGLAICIADDTFIALDQTTLCHVEIATVGKGQSLQPLLIVLQGDRRRILGRRSRQSTKRYQQGKGEQRLGKSHGEVLVIVWAIHFRQRVESQPIPEQHGGHRIT